MSDYIVFLYNGNSVETDSTRYKYMYKNNNQRKI